MRAMELGIDGNCGFALSGEDIQTGEAEFVEIKGKRPYRHQDEMNAMHAAKWLLFQRLKLPKLTWYHGESSPWGR